MLQLIFSCVVPLATAGSTDGQSTGSIGDLIASSWQTESGAPGGVNAELPTDIADPVEQPPSVLRMLLGTNVLGHVIVGLIFAISIISVYFTIEHLLTISRRRLMPDEVLAVLERLIVHGEINKAIEVCHQKANYSLSTEVILAGLQRYKSSEFGYAEYRSAVEEAGEDE